MSARFAAALTMCQTAFGVRACAPYLSKPAYSPEECTSFIMTSAAVATQPIT